MSTRAGPAKQAYHHGDLRRVLLDAATKRFAERGDFGFTLRELARDVGVSHNAPYRHFAGKDELLEALRDDGFTRLAERERRALDAAGADPRARVRALGEAYVRFALQDGPSFRLALALPPKKGSSRTDAAIASFSVLERTIAEAQRAGAVRTDLSAKELAVAAWSLVHGVATLLASGQLPTRSGHVARYTELLSQVFFDGAAAPRARAAG
ncbi:MAG: TetR/AcrR family transcriptional regulator [Myxococcales bacterium]|nr:TetR/AcrR family transcriptional regulator [Myxococcales bacterium]